MPIYNPSYSGGRDQENHGSKPALGPYLKRKKKNHKKWADGMTQAVREPA
jgi:hypothetical protein